MPIRELCNDTKLEFGSRLSGKVAGAGSEFNRHVFKGFKTENAQFPGDIETQPNIRNIIGRWG